LSSRRKEPISRFSFTVMRLNSRRFSGTIDTPRLTRSLVGHFVTTSPSRRTSPDEGITIPRMALSVVVLPEAFPPSRHTISPALIVRLTSLSTCTGP